MSDSGQDRTEQATPKRLKEAREKGQVARSRELSATAVMLASATGVLLLGETFADRMARLVRESMVHDRVELFDTGYMGETLARTAGTALEAMAPLLLVTLLAALLAPAVVGGFSFSLKAIAPKLEKLNPAKGIKRVFGASGLMELAKAMAKFVFVGVVSVLFLRHMAADFLSLSRLPLVPALYEAASLIAWSLLVLSTPLLVIAAIDVPFQLYQHSKQLKMTRQEVRDEHKETDGNPELKGRIRAMQQEVASRRMMEEVPKADVIITNPTHYAVALKYDESRMRAPRVVAKGANEVAARIRDLAREHSVPLFSAPPLARALHANSRLGDEVPAELYTAVAQVLAYVYQLRDARRHGGVWPERPAVDLDPELDPKERP